MARQGALRIVQGGIPLPDAPSLKLVKGGLDNLGGTVAKHGDDIASTAGKVFDIIGKVATVIDLIATLGTIIRMEQIARNSIERDEELQRQIQQLSNELNGLETMLSGQLDAILSDTSAILGQTGLIDNIHSQTGLIDDIYSQTGLIDDIYSQTGLIPDIKQDTNNIARITADTLQLTQLIPQIAPSVIAQIAPETCKALRNPNCFNIGDFDNNGCDLQPVINAISFLQGDINRISGAIGSGDGSCNNSFAFGSLTRGLEILVCGGSGSGFNFNEALEDYFANNEAVDLQPVIDKIESKGNEVIDAIEEIEVVATVPESWQVRVGADRPQLIVSYAETLTGGKIGRSRFPLTIPHWNGLKKWDLLPKWTKGNTQARLILKDNSRVYIYASSESMAIATMNKVIKFIDPNMIGNKTPFVGKANIEIKSRKVEPCTAKFYAKGQKTEIPEHYQIRAKNGKL